MKRRNFIGAVLAAGAALLGRPFRTEAAEPPKGPSVSRWEWYGFPVVEYTWPKNTIIAYSSGDDTSYEIVEKLSKASGTIEEEIAALAKTVEKYRWGHGDCPKEAKGTYYITRIEGHPERMNVTWHYKNVVPVIVADMGKVYYDRYTTEREAQHPLTLS